MTEKVDHAGWAQSIIPTILVICSVALSYGSLNQKVDFLSQQASEKTEKIDTLNKLLTNNTVDIIIIKKDLSVLEYKHTDLKSKVEKMEELWKGDIPKGQLIPHQSG